MNEDLEIMIKTLEEGTAIIEPKDGIRKKLSESYEKGEPLRIKLGFDPTAPDLHLGHAVVSKKLRQFQDFGHKIVVIIGDYTAQRGDPTGRKDTRPSLTEAQVAQNAETYLNQIGLILDLDKIEIRRNSEWHGEKSFADALNLAEHFNIARLFERKDFGDRYKAGQSVTLAELMYPGLQGQDSVEIKADIEIGGTDQLYNLLVGRDLQRDAKQEPQAVLCMPILPGTDGIVKMSKSKGNYIGLIESSQSMFQKIMALKDKVMDGDKPVEVVRTFVELLVSTPQTREKLLSNIADIESGKVGAEKYVDIKKELAFDIVKQFHSQNEAELALAYSENIQKLGLGSATISDFSASTEAFLNGVRASDLCKSLLAAINIDPVGSNNPKKLIQGGAVKINGSPVQDPNAISVLEPGMIISIGKKHAFNIKAQDEPPSPQATGPNFKL